MANLPIKKKAVYRDQQKLAVILGMSNEHYYIEDTTLYIGEFDSIQLRGDGVQFEVLKGKEQGSDTEIDLMTQYNLTGVELNGVSDLEPPLISPRVFTQVKLVKGKIRLNR